MAERVQPHGDAPPPPARPPAAPPAAPTAAPPELQKSDPTPPNPPPIFAPKPQPKPGTYVVQIPKDQIYRVPPPENAHKFRKFALRSKRRSRGCCCCFLPCLLFPVLILGTVAAVFYFTVRPKEPNYSVDSIAISGFNLSSADLALSPEFDVTVRADNPNKKISIYYGEKSFVAVSHSGVELCTGLLPAFYQGTKNVTVFTTILHGSGIQLTGGLRDALVAEQGKGEIPLILDLEIPVKIKVWGIKTWTMDVKVRCDVKVDKLASDAKVISRDCRVNVDPWWW